MIIVTSWLFFYFKKYAIIKLQRNKRVENAETFDAIWYKIFDKYVSTHIFVAHGASFDLTAIRKTLQFYGKNLPEIRYICTQLIAREVGLPCESREDLCKYFNLCIQTNHNAFSDVKDC